MGSQLIIPNPAAIECQYLTNRIAIPGDKRDESDYHRAQRTRDAGLQGFPQPRKSEPPFSIRSKYPDDAERSHEPRDAALVGVGGDCYLAARPVAVFQNVRNTKFRRHVNCLGYPVPGRQLEQ